MPLGLTNYGVARTNFRSPTLVVGPSFNTWSLTDKVNATLSPDLLTATAINDGAASFQAGRAVRGVQSGEKKFWSVKVTALPTASNNVAVGMASDTYGPFSSFLGTGNSNAQYFNDAHLFMLGASQAVTNLWALNNVIDFAVDHTPGVDLVWARIDGGVWNAGGGADPATGAGGFDTSAITGGQSPAIIYPAYQLLGDAGGVGTVVLNSGATAYPFAPPAGFGNI